MIARDTATSAVAESGAGATVIVEADNIVPVGVISPDHVMTPAPVVDYIVSHA